MGLGLELGEEFGYQGVGVEERLPHGLNYGWDWNWGCEEFGLELGLERYGVGSELGLE